MHNHHGGQLKAAAQRYQIPESDWLDLSTGINPQLWPVPPLPTACWQRLPEDNDKLQAAAHHYYQTQTLLPIAGSQAAIQVLPMLRPPSRVVVPVLGYSEHQSNWARLGHQVTALDTQAIESNLDQWDVVIVINPNNPSGEMIDTATLLRWQAALSKRNGWLIIDEAFMDTTPEYSLTPYCPLPGLIILRSLGKFFGLAGIRCGFILAESALLAQLQTMLGPWALNTPARWITTRALQDHTWQISTRNQLMIHAKKLQHLLSIHTFNYLGGTALFQTVLSSNAITIYEQALQQGILLRLLDNQQGLRFGLPNTDQDWQRLRDFLGKQ